MVVVVVLVEAARFTRNEPFFGMITEEVFTVVVVADRSESMPKNASAVEKEIIELLHKSMGPRDQLGVVAFGRKAIVEQSPQRGAFGGFTAFTNRIGHFVGFAEAVTDLAGSVADDNQRSEAETASTFDHF